MPPKSKARHPLSPRGRARPGDTGRTVSSPASRGIGIRKSRPDVQPSPSTLRPTKKAITKPSPVKKGVLYLDVVRPPPNKTTTTAPSKKTAEDDDLLEGPPALSEAKDSAKNGVSVFLPTNINSPEKGKAASNNTPVELLGTKPDLVMADPKNGAVSSLGLGKNDNKSATATAATLNEQISRAASDEDAIELCIAQSNAKKSAQKDDTNKTLACINKIGADDRNNCTRATHMADSQGSLNAGGIGDADSSVGGVSVICGACDTSINNNQQYVANNPNLLIFDGAKFPSYPLLAQAMDDVGRLTGMRPSEMAHKTKGTYPPEEALRLFGHEAYHIGNRQYKIPKRGHFYCNHKECPFFVPFTHMAEKGSKQKQYIIKGFVASANGNKNLCLSHNHQTVDTGIDGYVEVKMEKDMYVDEIEFVKNASLLRTRMPSLQEAMTKKFQGRMFDSQMLHRIIKRYRDTTVGPNRHRLPDLIKMGEEAKANGGAWEVVPDPETLTIDGTRYQTPRMSEYGMQFGSYYTTCDGTYGTNKYALTAFPWITSDGLGLSHCIGFSMARSENSKDVIAAGRLFKLSSQSTDPNQTVSVLHYITVSSTRVSHYTCHVLPGPSGDRWSYN